MNKHKKEVENSYMVWNTVETYDKKWHFSVRESRNILFWDQFLREKPPKISLKVDLNLETILDQFSTHFLTITNLPFLSLTLGLENLEFFWNMILSSIIINDFEGLSWEIWIQPLFFLWSIIRLKVSFLSITFTGKNNFL